MHTAYSTQKYRINDYLVSYAFRHKKIECLYLWLFMRALDLELHNKPTGFIKPMSKLTKILANRMSLSSRQVQRLLHKGQNIFWYFDREEDFLQIFSRARATHSGMYIDDDLYDMRRLPNNIKQDFIDLDEETVVSPFWMRGPEDLLSVDITISDIYIPGNKQLSHSRLADIIRQKCTEYGYARLTQASLLGITKRSSNRLDKDTGVRRGWQSAYSELSSIMTIPSQEQPNSTNQIDIGNKILLALHKEHANGTGKKGRKHWIGKSPDSGKPALFMQLPVKYHTRFAGSLKIDPDIEQIYRIIGAKQVINRWKTRRLTAIREPAEAGKSRYKPVSEFSVDNRRSVENGKIDIWLSSNYLPTQYKEMPVVWESPSFQTPLKRIKK